MFHWASWDRLCYGYVKEDLSTTAPIASAPAQTCMKGQGTQAEPLVFYFAMYMYDANGTCLPPFERLSA